MHPHHSVQKALHVFMILLAALLPLASAAAAQSTAASPSALADDPQPVLLKDIYTADASSDPMDFFDFGDVFFYSGSDLAYGRELWVSNGTADGTRMVKDIVSGPDSSYPRSFTRFRDKVFFSANSSGNGVGHGLWYTDGSAGGTINVFTTLWDFGYGSVDALVPQGDWLYFICGWSLLRYGGPQNTWERVLPNNFQLSSINIAVMNGGLYFSATNGVSGYEPWRYDFTTGQVSLVKDICPGTCLEYEWADPGSDPDFFTVSGNRLYFTAVDADHGQELWVSDGSEAGTHLVKDLRAGKDSSVTYDSDLTPAGGWLYFRADDGLHGQELWRTDGSEANTSLVDLAPGALSALPQSLTALDAGGSLRLIFSANAGQGQGSELWSLPVVPAGMEASPILLETAPGAASGLPDFLTVLGDFVYFAAQDTPGNVELWRTGGTPESTARVADLVLGPDGSAPEMLATWNGKLVFSAVDAVNGREPWLSDGSPAGTAMIGNMAYTVDVDGSSPDAGLLTNVGGVRIRYFFARDPLHGIELWRTDGTAEGTRLVKDIYPGPGLDYNYCDRSMAEMNGILYFCGYDPENGMNLWRSDGTAAGTWLLKVIAPGYLWADPTGFTPVGSQLFFTAYDEEHGYELWVSDGSEAGTHLVKDILPGNTGSRHILRMAALGSQLIFWVDTEPYQWSLQLWRSDGTTEGTQKFAGPYTFSDDCGNLFEPAQGETKIYFTMCDPADPDSNTRLWYTDGTAAGTQMISWNGEYFYRDPGDLRWAGGTLYFTAWSSLPGVAYNALTLWSLSPGSTRADLQEWWLGSYDSLRFWALNPTTLLLLTDDDYSNENVWWMYDTQSGERRSVPYDTHPSQVINPVPWRGKMYFTASGSYDLPDGLWVTDGSEAGTKDIPNPATGLPFTGLDSFLSTFNNLYFSADDGIHGSEPWVLSAGEVKQIYLPVVRR